jgi:hypothetical protein
MKLRVRFDYPKGWTQTNNASKHSSEGSLESQDTKLSMTPIARTA